MAQQATVYHLQIELSDVDRGVYEALDLRLGRHPSESMSYLLTRTIAYALLYEEGIAFSKGGLSSTDEPPLSHPRPAGQPARLDRDRHAVGRSPAQGEQGRPRVVVFTQHDPASAPKRPPPRHPQGRADRGLRAGAGVPRELARSPIATLAGRCCETTASSTSPSATRPSPPPSPPTLSSARKLSAGCRRAGSRRVAAGGPAEW